MNTDDRNRGGDSSPGSPPSVFMDPGLRRDDVLDAMDRDDLIESGP
jgi:hypothetical protein